MFYCFLTFSEKNLVTGLEKMKNVCFAILWKFQDKNIHHFYAKVYFKLEFRLETAIRDYQNEKFS